MEIDIQNLSFNFKTQNIFENTTVSFTEGKISFIMAPNGRGKTTTIETYFRKSACEPRPYK